MKAELKGKTLTLTVELDMDDTEATLSSTGKSYLRFSSGGWMPLPVSKPDGMRIMLSVMRPTK